MKNSVLILILFAVLLNPFQSDAQTPVILKTDTVNIACTNTDTFHVAFRVRNFNNIGAMQFTGSWTPVANLVLDTILMNPAFTGPTVNIGFDTTTYINSGRFTFTWTKLGGGSVPDDSYIFKAVFKRLGGAFTPVRIIGSPIAIEVNDAAADPLPFTVIPGGVKPFDTELPQIVCPANVTEEANAPSPVLGIAPMITDNCQIAQTGWTAIGATPAAQPNDPDASGTVFNFGQTTITYTTTDAGNNTATCSFSVVLIPAVSSDTLTVIASNETSNCNQQVIIDLTTFNFDSLGSLQFTMNWDESVLRFDSVSYIGADLTGLTPVNFGTTQVNNGVLTFSWTTFTLLGGTSLPQGATLFRVYLTTIGASGSNTNFFFNSSPTIQEAYSNASFPPLEIPTLYVNGLVNIEDITAPTIVCPPNQSVMTPSGVITADFNNLQPTLSDNCSGAVALSYVRSGTTPGSGSGNANGTYLAGLTTVTYTATDAAGNSATCSFLVNVDAGTPVGLLIDTVLANCNGASTITMNFRVTNFADVIGLQFVLQWDPTVLQFNTVGNFYPGLNLSAFSFASSDYPNGIMRFLDGTSNLVTGWPNIPDGGIFFTITFNVLNPNGSTAVAFQGYPDAVRGDGTFSSMPVNPINGYFAATVDQGPPTFTFCPPNINVQAPAGQCTVAVNIPSPDVIDDCSGIASLISSEIDNIFPVGNTTVIYTATDSVGNSSTCSHVVSVADITPPVISNCPVNTTLYVSAEDCQVIANWQAPNVADACFASNITLLVSALPGFAMVAGDVQTITYEATDGAGNSATCSFTLTAADSTAPKLINCPGTVEASPIANSCSGIATFDQPDASDNCSQNVLIENNSGWMSGDTFPAGNTVVTFLATDDAGNTATCSFTVIVPDTTAPVLICPANLTLFTPANGCTVTASWQAATVSDNCTQNPTLDVDIASGSVFQVGTNAVTYTASDNGGNETTCAFEVIVRDTFAPVFLTCPQNIIVQLPVNDCDTTLTWAAPQVSDNCGINSFFPNIQPNTVFTPGLDTIVYTAIDPSGNTRLCTFTVRVVDQVAPILGTCPKDTVITNGSACGLVLNWTPPTYSDNCTPVNELVYTSTKEPTDTLFPGTTKITIQVTDASGNFDTCSFQVNIIPTALQGFVNIPQSDTLVFDLTSTCSTVVNWTPPGVAGYCEPPVISVSPANGTTFGIGEHLVTYTATDTTTGGISTATFIITVTENIAPIMLCPSAPTVLSVAGVEISDPGNFIASVDTAMSCRGVEVTFSLPQASDNCTTPPLVTQITGTQSGGILDIGSNVLVFQAADSSGNTASCSVTVNVLELPALQGNIDPAIACPGDDVMLSVQAVPGANYIWSGPQPNLPNAPSITLTNLNGSNAGTYTVQASFNGCPTAPITLEAMLSGTPLAVDDLDFIIDPGMTDTFNVFTNDFLPIPSDAILTLVSQTPGLTYIGNGNFVYTAGATVSFIYELCSETCGGCTMADVTITVRDTRCTFIPNLITPNDDSVNDYLEIPCLESGNFNENSIVIYNKWGDKVFEASPYSNDAQKAWRGTLNGEAGKHLPDGTYYYVFKPGPNEIPLKGFVEVYR